MEKITKDQLTLFAEDFPANPSQLQASNLERQMTVTSGLKCYESSKSRLPLGSLAKTFLGSSGWHSTMCALTWKVKVTESNRLLFRLVPSKPTTAETDAGLWPTPTRMTGGEEIAPSHRNGTHGWNIGAAVKDSLSKDPLRVWPTPTTREHKGARSQEAMEKSDAVEAQSDYQTPKGKLAGSLNPTWVEWLMGFPIGWTELDPSETR